MELTKEILIQILDERLEIKFDEKLKELPTRQDCNTIISKLDDIQETVERIDKRADEDVRAAYKDIEKHEKPITVIEGKIGLQI